MQGVRGVKCSGMLLIKQRSPKRSGDHMWICKKVIELKSCFNTLVSVASFYQNHDSPEKALYKSHKL